MLTLEPTLGLPIKFDKSDWLRIRKCSENRVRRLEVAILSADQKDRGLHYYCKREDWLSTNTAQWQCDSRSNSQIPL